MNESTEPRIISADRTSRGIIVTFEDGKCALYTATFLRANYLRAEVIHDGEQRDAEML